MGYSATIQIPMQFERTSEHGYLASHIALTAKLKSLLERPDVKSDITFAERSVEHRKNELFEQACEDVARGILLSEKEVTGVPVAEARQMVLDEYNKFLADPKLADASRASAVH